MGSESAKVEAEGSMRFKLWTGHDVMNERTNRVALRLHRSYRLLNTRQIRKAGFAAEGVGHHFCRDGSQKQVFLCHHRGLQAFNAVDLRAVRHLR